MSKATHREVKFSKEEMEYDLPDALDSKKFPYIGQGREGIEMARRISDARGAEKRKLMESPTTKPEKATAKASVESDSDVAEVFKDSASVNKALRAIIDAIPANAVARHRKSA